MPEWKRLIDRLRDGHQTAWDVNKWGFYFVGAAVAAVFVLWVVTSVLGLLLD